jgi:glycosyltransferase involved in cell wall biosynthesis
VNGPLVTIVTPSFNQGHFIAATIESVLAQDYPHIEYIVMDGGSTDSTADAVRPYLDRLLFLSEPDRGQTHAINKGFQMARGEIVAWINSDDLLLPGAVSRAVEALRLHPSTGAIYGDGYQIDFDGNIKQQFPFTEPFNLWKLTFLYDYILQQTVFFRRDCLASLGWLNEDLHFGMDWDILVRLGKQHGLVYIPALLGCLREYDEAKSFAGGARRFAELARLLHAQTGLRRPPGWWFYGLDTYDKIWSARIRRWLPGPLGRLLATRFVQLCRARIHHVQHHSQGLYPGGWVARTLHWMMPACYSAAILRGFVPEGIARQQFRVFVNNALAARHELPPGDFSIELPITPTREPALLRIEASSVSGPSRFAWRLLGFDGRL